jgi:hypothetical protein
VPLSQCQRFGNSFRLPKPLNGDSVYRLVLLAVVVFIHRPERQFGPVTIQTEERFGVTTISAAWNDSAKPL